MLVQDWFISGLPKTPRSCARSVGPMVSASMPGMAAMASRWLKALGFEHDRDEDLGVGIGHRLVGQAAGLEVGRGAPPPMPREPIGV